MFFRIFRLATLFALTLLAPAGCFDGGSVGQAIPPSPKPPGGDATVSEPLRRLCAASTHVCPFENAPLIDTCTPDGMAFERSQCPPGQVCTPAGCRPFTCAPGRDVCLDATTLATCDNSGQGFVDRRRCESPGEVCRGGFCIEPCQSAAASGSYIGCEYWARELPNLYRTTAGLDDAPFGIVVANPSGQADALVSLTVPDGTPVALIEETTIHSANRSQSVTLRSAILDQPPRPITGAPLDVRIPARKAAVFLLEPTAPHMPDAVRIRSTQPVVAYQFSPYCCNFTHTNDASLLLPTATWGTEYRVVNYPTMTLENGAAIGYTPYVTVVAAEDDTVVTIESPVPLQAGTTPVSTAGSRELSVTLRAGEARTFGAIARSRYDATQLRETDISGAVVRADRPIAAFAGHVCTFVPQDKWACDHLESQLLPSATLGRNYLLTPARLRNLDDDATTEGIYWRIVADEDARIRVTPPLDELELLPESTAITPSCAATTDAGEVVLAAGQVCEFGTRAPVSLQSSGRLLVAGLLTGQETTGLAVAGDPSLFILAPVEQLRSSYAFAAPPTYAHTFVSVAIRDAGPLLLDGQPVGVDRRLQRARVEHDGTTWETFSIALTPGVHHLESNEPFGIIVYAYDDYVSYAFTGGLDLLPKGAQ